MYEASIPILVNSSPSFSINNLSSSVSCQYLTYLRANEIYIQSINSDRSLKVPTSSSFSSSLSSIINKASYITINDDVYLVVTSNHGVNIYSYNGQDMISFFSLKSLSLIVNDDEEDTHYMNGISSSSNNLSIGSSTGHILIIEYNKGRKEFHEKQKLFTINNPITALAQSNKYLVCANGDGDVFVFDSTDEYKLLEQYKGSGFTCTCLGIKGDIIIAGYITGHIKLFNANDIEVFIEITAHIRMITGMDVHPNENIFITCSEDHYVQVWALPIRLTSSSIINTIFTRKLENKLCTGIAFLSDGRICVSSYDDNELNIFVKQ